MMIPVGDQFALIDEADAEMLAPFSWYPQKNGRTVYACTSIKRKTIPMHRMITGWDYVDHINGDGLDNRRENLRAATHAQNNMNRRKLSHFKGREPTSEFKGVTRMRDERTGEFVDKWSAQIRVNGRLKRLGTFTNETKAAAAYDDAAVRNFGEFAKTNFGATAAG